MSSIPQAGTNAGVGQSMSNHVVNNAQQAPFNNQSNSNQAKKAVHVKWAGKTIALGTFSAAEADEKCARAKALTRAWRSTMRPKPNREWVMLELERLQVRVVSGRLGRKGEGGEEKDDDEEGNMSGQPKANDIDPNVAGRRDSLMSMGARRDSITASLLSAADMARGVGSDRNNSLDWAGGDPAQRRSSTLALSLFQGDEKSRRDSLLSAKFDFGKKGGAHRGSHPDGGGQDVAPPHRPLVGGGAAAAYEAARADHYSNVAAQKALADSQQQQRGSVGGLGLGGLASAQGSTGLLGATNNLGASGSMPQLGMNPNQHYEMLKLHHMNLLNEIQETTLMMNLYQQQQQQQQLQQPSGTDGQQGGSLANASAAEQQLALQLQQSNSNSLNLDSIYGGGSSSGAHLQSLQGMQQRSSMGLGGLGGGTNSATGASNQMQALLRQQNMLQASGGSSGLMGDTNSLYQQQQRRISMQHQMQQQAANQQKSLQDDQQGLEEKLQRLKEDIAERQRQAQELEAAASGRTATNPARTKRKSADDNNDGDDDGAEYQDSERNDADNRSKRNKSEDGN